MHLTSTARTTLTELPASATAIFGSLVQRYQAEPSVAWSEGLRIGAARAVAQGTKITDADATLGMPPYAKIYWYAVSSLLLNKVPAACNAMTNVPVMDTGEGAISSIAFGNTTAPHAAWYTPHDDVPIAWQRDQSGIVAVGEWPSPPASDAVLTPVAPLRFRLLRGILHFDARASMQYLGCTVPPRVPASHRGVPALGQELAVLFRACTPSEVLTETGFCLAPVSLRRYLRSMPPHIVAAARLACGRSIAGRFQNAADKLGLLCSLAHEFDIACKVHAGMQPVGAVPGSEACHPNWAPVLNQQEARELAAGALCAVADAWLHTGNVAAARQAVQAAAQHAPKLATVLVCQTQVALAAGDPQAPALPADLTLSSAHAALGHARALRQAACASSSAVASAAIQAGINGLMSVLSDTPLLAATGRVDVGTELNTVASWAWSDEPQRMLAHWLRVANEAARPP